MCLIAFSYQIHPKYPFILIANRDEFYNRPTQSVHFWTSVPHILAGKDLEAGGTWMGITKSGRFAALTNYRDPKNINKDRKSRGELPLNFLNSENSSEQYIAQIDNDSTLYNGYNLLVWDGMTMMHYNNENQQKTTILPGIYGLSNATLNSPWPKVTKLKQQFAQTISDEFHYKELFALLVDKELAPNQNLPDTGIALELEKSLSAVFIVTEKYGTVGSTVITIDYQNEVNFIEKTHELPNRDSSFNHFQFKIKK